MYQVKIYDFAAVHGGEGGSRTLDALADIYAFQAYATRRVPFGARPSRRLPFGGYCDNHILNISGGGRGIRTLEDLATLHAFQACALDQLCDPTVFFCYIFLLFVSDRVLKIPFAFTGISSRYVLFCIYYLPRPEWPSGSSRTTIMFFNSSLRISGYANIMSAFGIFNHVNKIFHVCNSAKYSISNSQILADLRGNFN